MKILLTAGPTHEPIDAVRFIGNRSSGQMGAAIAQAAIDAGHDLTFVVGPVTAVMPKVPRRIDIESAHELQKAVLTEFPNHDLLIMAAAVADFTPKTFHGSKVPRGGAWTLELVPTEDIAAAAGAIKRDDQRTVGFSLEHVGNIHRSREKLVRKKLDLIVYNPTATLNSSDVDPVLLYPDGREEAPGAMSKVDFARLLILRSVRLFTNPNDETRNPNK
jgi:phosphopantothenoylcysteine decarboxylase/phosphopantothenate--cysteine ligase